MSEGFRLAEIGKENALSSGCFFLAIEIIMKIFRRLLRKQL